MALMSIWSQLIKNVPYVSFNLGRISCVYGLKRLIRLIKKNTIYINVYIIIILIMRA